MVALTIWAEDDLANVYYDGEIFLEQSEDGLRTQGLCWLAPPAREARRLRFYSGPYTRPEAADTRQCRFEIILG